VVGFAGEEGGAPVIGDERDHQTQSALVIAADHGDVHLLVRAHEVIGEIGELRAAAALVWIKKRVEDVADGIVEELSVVDKSLGEIAAAMAAPAIGDVLRNERWIFDVVRVTAAGLTPDDLPLLVIGAEGQVGHRVGVVIGVTPNGQLQGGGACGCEADVIDGDVAGGRVVEDADARRKSAVGGRDLEDVLA
jgi:hypothetical protein